MQALQTQQPGSAGNRSSASQQMFGSGGGGLGSDRPMAENASGQDLYA